MKPVIGPALLSYAKEHLDFRSDNIAQVIKPLHVFKKVWVPNPHPARSIYPVRPYPAIANLIIPEGALVHIDNFAFEGDFASAYARKMRASFAFCHSIVRTHNKEQVTTAHSGFDVSFWYTAGEDVAPRLSFAMKGSCASGIHFFMNLGDAKEWSL